MRRSGGTSLPADIYSVFKDNTSGLVGERDGCASWPRLMDTHIYSAGPRLASSQVQEASFPTCKALFHSCAPIYLKPAEQMCTDSNSASQYIPAAPSNSHTAPFFSPRHCNKQTAGRPRRRAPTSTRTPWERSKQLPTLKARLEMLLLKHAPSFLCQRAANPDEACVCS